MVQVAKELKRQYLDFGPLNNTMENFKDRLEDVQIEVGNGAPAVISHMNTFDLCGIKSELIHGAGNTD